MSGPSIRDVVLETLRRLAPEADLAALDPEASLREQLDLDSMDFLRFLTLLAERFGFDIPDADASRLVTLAGAISYLAARTASVG